MHIFIENTYITLVLYTDSHIFVFDKFLSFFNSLQANGEFCHLLMIFANSLDPDQARKNVGPDLDASFSTL